MANSKKAKKPIQVGPIRHNLEAFGVAILAAVLLKWFCIEAYQIPTSSMQPTLMGSSEAGVYDRILVDKLIQTFREPQRWDITVFKYPLQKNQNYVKRIGGMPGDRLTIAGGNLYQVEGDGSDRKLTIIRKPEDLQRDMWKNVFPARMEARSETKALGDIFVGSPRQAADEVDGAITLDGRGKSSRLYFRDKADGGMIDRVWDGYPAAVAREIREKTAHERPQELVQDVRITANVTPDAVPEQLWIEVEIVRPGHDDRGYALVLEDGKGRLVVRGKNEEVLAQSEPFDCPLAAGATTELSFAHVDDQLIAWQDGEYKQTFDAAAWPCIEGCVLPRGEIPTNQKSIPQFVVKGKSKVKLADIRIDRDQHYTRDIAPEVIEVPEGHYYMLGDNTLQSIDSRGWTAVEIGVDENGWVVPPDSPKAVRTLRGNKRAMNLGNAPDRDETPIALPDRDAIVMIDEFGEIHRLKAKIGPSWGEMGKVSFVAGETEWEAPETSNTEGISFVPRSDIEGRALMVFYPLRPISWLTGSAWPDRAGFVR